MAWTWSLFRHRENLGIGVMKKKPLHKPSSIIFITLSLFHTPLVYGFYKSSFLTEMWMTRKIPVTFDQAKSYHPDWPKGSELGRFFSSWIYLPREYLSMFIICWNEVWCLKWSWPSFVRQISFFFFFLIHRFKSAEIPF